MIKHSNHPAPEMTVRFWGVRGSLPSPGPETQRIGGNTACVEVRHAGHILILDAGTGIRPLGNALVEEFEREGLETTILISHTHWDHIQGFPFFSPSFRSGNRVTICGAEERPGELRGVFERQMDTPVFPVRFDSLPAAIDFQLHDGRPFEIGPFRITPGRLNHPGLCHGFRIETDGGIFVYAPDHEAAGCAYGVAGETEVDLAERMILLLADADLVVMDAHYTAAEYPKHCGWGHSSVEQAVGVAAVAGAKEMRFFHHHPDHDDTVIELMEGYARNLADELGCHMKIEAAREGSEVRLAAG